MVTNNRPRAYLDRSIDEWQKFTGESRSQVFPVEDFLQEAIYKKAAGQQPAAMLQMVLSD